MAVGAVEMNVVFGVGDAGAVVLAYRKSCGAVIAYYFMYYASFFKVFQCAIKGYSVYLAKGSFQFSM